jgi:hypothetical protein
MISFFSTILLFIGIFYTGFMGNLNKNGLIPADTDELRWNWDRINIDAKEIAIKLKRRTNDFKWGTASAGIIICNI